MIVEVLYLVDTGIDVFILAIFIGPALWKVRISREEFEEAKRLFGLERKDQKIDRMDVYKIPSNEKAVK